MKEPKGGRDQVVLAIKRGQDEVDQVRQTTDDDAGGVIGIGSGSGSGSKVVEEEAVVGVGVGCGVRSRLSSGSFPAFPILDHNFGRQEKKRPAGGSDTTRAWM